ncbi:hypothetical protein [Natronococcus sp. A-GB7]|uniref:hypothetical protein n=1 Tax=Natronococcus sp. A-GB7 TaxID=3037649 RepID=UPI00241C209A|nr:hypothetical protein [Natronococcus sp. A-GB7]MDG5818973.1 hypothetical protein [Natronococcus sp. A-GB7]
MRENKVIAGFVVVAIGLYFALLSFTALQFEIVLGISMLIGVIAPMMVNNYLDNQSEQ